MKGKFKRHKILNTRAATKLVERINITIMLVGLLIENEPINVILNIN